MTIIKAGDKIKLRVGTYTVIKNDGGVIWYTCPSGQGQTIAEFVTAINGVKVPKAKQPSYIDIINKL
jgi:hypothetical protein